jgi:hypothetical protein
MKTRHVNLVFNSMAGGRVYCYKFDAVSDFNEEQAKKCFDCEYFSGSSYGDGVVCAYDSKAEQEQIILSSPVESEYWSKSAMERMGIKTREEVVDSMVLNIDDTTIENLIEGLNS